jgi:hypothetical protein
MAKNKSISELQTLGWTHVECVSDFCGNHKSPGAWADLMQRPDGSQVIKLGGNWRHYGQATPEYIEADDPHFQPFLVACAEDTDFTYARTHWSS